MGRVLSDLFHYKYWTLQCLRAALKPFENLSRKIIIVKLRCLLVLCSPMEVS